MASATENRNEERRKRVFVGKLPSDFLRLTSHREITQQEQQEAADAQAALALQQQLIGSSYSYNLSGKLSITVAQAKLVKNYGMTRMDPYVRLRVGHSVYETHTDPSGGKNPKWNRIVQCLLPHGVNSIYLEIFDENSFTVDELIAWTHIPIPQNVMNGETYEDWFPLSGKQGEGVEGMINLVISFSPGQYSIYSPVQSVLMDVGNSAYNLRTVPVSYTPTPITQVVPPPQPVIHLSAEDLKQTLLNTISLMTTSEQKMTEINFEALTARKKFIFEELTRLYNVVSKPSFDGEIEAETLLISLNKLESNYYDLVNEILTANTLAERGKGISTKDFDAFTTIIEKTRLCCLKCKAAAIAASKKTELEKCNTKLPKITLPTFSGDLNEWNAFIDQYDAAIHTKQIGKIEKLTYLRSVLKGEPLAIVMQYDLKEESYELAYKALRKRFNNPRILANHHVSKILNFKSTIHSDKFFSEYLTVHRAATASLRNLEITDLADYLLYELSYRNLSLFQQKIFDREIGPAQIPTLDDLFSHIDNLAKTEELHSESNSSGKSKTRRALLGVKNDNLIRICPHCEQEHPLFRCKTFEERPLEEKLQVVSKHGACKSCLGIHKGVCKSNYCCRHCQSKEHHTFLCDNMNNVALLLQTASLRGPNLAQKVCNAYANICPRNPVILGTIQTYATDLWGNFHAVRVICDLGSQVNIVTNSLVKRLGLRCCAAPFDVEGVSQSNSKVLGAVSLELKSPERKDVRFDCSAVVLSSICGALPAVSEALPESIKHLPLADPEFHKSKPIDVLLGADACADILESDDTPIVKGDPTALRTIFGYILFGRAQPKINTPVVSLCTSTLDRTLRSFWESEDITPASIQDPDDVICENHFIQTHTRDPDGRYVVRLPFRTDATPVGSNLKAGWRSLTRLEERFRRSPELASSYKAVIQDYLDQKHMSCAPEEEKYVLPHHCVFKNSSTTAVRVVFDASSPDESGQSINSRLLSGPKLQQDLPRLLISFRRHEVALQSDIKQMFRNIKIHPDDRKYQRVLWRTTSEEAVKQYSLNTVTFGFTCAPFLAQRVLRQLAEDEGENYPEAKKAILHSCFMDDFVTGAPSVRAAKKLREDLTKLLAKGGFELRKWVSSHPEVLEQLPDDYKETPFMFPTGEKGVKVLGLLWEQSSDSFRFHVSKFEAPKVTKRTILSYIARIWDCLGMVSPVVLKAKSFLQRLWLLNIDWDDHLSHELCMSWLKLTSEMPLLQQIKIPRKLPIAGNDLRLIGFSDASEIGMAANVYLHSTRPDGTVECHLLMSKTKLAPLKTWTIPRLELAAAVLLSKMISFILQLEFEIKETILYTDSQIVIAWLKIPPHNLKIFVANRVIQILENVPSNVWKFIPGNLNPADLSSRGLLPSELVKSNLWWKGPDELHQPVECWPDYSQTIDLNIEECPEIKDSVQGLIVKPISTELRVTELIENISSFTKLTRIVAFILRFVRNCRNKEKLKENFLTSGELKFARDTIVRLTQEKYFSAEIDNIQRGKEISKFLKNLNPFIDQARLLRAGGRLRRAQSLSEEARYPIILPKNCNVSAIICDHYHLKLLHAGPKLTKAAILQSFWILSLNQLVKKRIRLCLRCFKLMATPNQPIMGELPYARVNVSRPFSNTSLDFGGPIYTKESRLRSSVKHKSYFCVFVCQATKAIHIEAVSDLTTKGFLAALHRFVARRGLPSQIFSDCGRNFVGAARDIKENAESKFCETSIKEFCAAQGISWHFFPPYAPNFNGLAEGAIKAAKKHLIRQIGEEILTFEEFSTLLCRIESVLNSRPLIALGSDPDDKQLYLSPAHFLIGDQLLNPPEKPTEFISLKDRWERVQRKSQVFWKQWSREYLHTMLQRQRWNKDIENLKIGQVVFIKGENLPPLQWPLGRVTSLRYGEDGVVRVATIRCANGEICRPVNKLLILPENE